MKLTYSPTSPFARKVRIAAIELGLIDKIELAATTVSPTTPNPAYAHDISPLRKLPALIVDDGLVIVDSFNITEYLDELAGGKLLPKSGAARWKAKSAHTIIQGMTEAMLLSRYESVLRPKEFFWKGWYDDQWDRAWQGFAHFEEQSEMLEGPFDIVQIAMACVLGYADFRYADCGWRAAFPKLAAFNERALQRESVKISVPPKA